MMRDILDSEDMFAPRGYSSLAERYDEIIARRGHRPGGDPVQQHSAGDFYPFVIAVIESPQHGREYEVLGPRLGKGWRFKRADDAERCAKNWKDRWERRPRPRPVKTLGDYLANKYDTPYPDSEGGEL